MTIRCGQRSTLGQLIKLACQSGAADREIDNLMNQLAAVVIDDVEDAKAAAVC
jgi:hypothetical protein